MKTKKQETTPTEKLLGACKTGATAEDLKNFRYIEKTRELLNEMKMGGTMNKPFYTRQKKP